MSSEEQSYAAGHMDEERWLVLIHEANKSLADTSNAAYLFSPWSDNRTYVEVDSALVDWETAARWVLDNKERLRQEGDRAVVVYVGDVPPGRGPVARPVCLPDGTWYEPWQF